MRKTVAEACLDATNITPGMVLSRDELGLWDFWPAKSEAHGDREVQFGFMRIYEF